MKPLLSAVLALGLTLPAAADDSLEGLKSRIVGQWTSIACELRPGPNQQNPDGKPVPTYLTRDFTYDAIGGFTGDITIYADPACAAPLATYSFAGVIVWHGPNPAAPGAFSQDYVLNRKLQITVVAPPMAAQLNALPEGACGEGPFVVGEAKDILGQPCILLRSIEGSAFVIDHDLLYVREDAPNLLFMGGKHVDGTGFYYAENRPTVGLQQPLARVR
ncbi:MAG: hypothetical protein AAF401_04105 [Pseudomonadota bacterium]